MLTASEFGSADLLIAGQVSSLPPIFKEGAP
jgi:hypothetical protein